MSIGKGILCVLLVLLIFHVTSCQWFEETEEVSIPYKQTDYPQQKKWVI